MLIWLTSRGGFFEDPIHIKTPRTRGKVAVINAESTRGYGPCRKIIIRGDLDKSDFSNDELFILGKDAVLIEVDAELERRQPAHRAGTSEASVNSGALKISKLRLVVWWRLER